MIITTVEVTHFVIKLDKVCPLHPTFFFWKRFCPSVGSQTEEACSDLSALGRPSSRVGSVWECQRQQSKAGGGNFPAVLSMCPLLRGNRQGFESSGKMAYGAVLIKG
jgi:hypothetical protein